MEMVKLIEPNGTEGIIVSMNYAINYCKSHIGWNWRLLSMEEIDALV